MNSQTEENYLKTIFQLSEKNDGCRPASTNAIAKVLRTTAASVSDMLKKLSTKGLVNHEKYKGVSLTDDGERLAKNLIRKHRLWEVFLVEKLNFTWDQVHDIAEELEHIQSELLTNRIDAFLNFPEYDPHGDPIPDRNGNIHYHEEISLADLKVGQTGVVVGVKDTSSKFLQFLDSMEIGLGTTMYIKQRIEYDDTLVIEMNGTKPLTISQRASSNLYVKTEKHKTESHATRHTE